MRPPLVCAGCGKRPAEIDSYVAMTFDEEGQPTGQTPDDFVWAEEGTLNRTTGQFLCDSCYIAAGMPSAPGGWKVPG